jgi:3-oxoadipate enol-lactonase
MAHELYAADHGDGTPVVLLHGLLATGDMFRWFAAPLADSYRLIVPDLPGHGRSADVPGPYRVDALAGAVAALVERLGAGPAHVMGYSHGGAVAQQLAHDAPDLVRSLALVATYAHNTATRRERAEAWVLPVLLRLLGTRRVATMVIRPGIGGGPPLPPEQITWLRTMISGNDQALMARAAAELSRFDSRDWLAELRVPTLVVSGGGDTAVPAYHATMLAHDIPGAETATITDAGHTMVWTHPRELAEILTRWWETVDR